MTLLPRRLNCMMIGSLTPRQPARGPGWWLVGGLLLLAMGCGKAPVMTDSSASRDGTALMSRGAPAAHTLPAEALRQASIEADAPLISTAATRPAASELNLLAMGDWGEGAPAQKKVADAMAAYVSRQHQQFAALISAGDNFYVPLSGANDPVWQTLFEQMYDPKRLDFPFYIALGNHDYDQNKYRIELAYARLHPDSRWKQPGRWFRVDLPENAPLVTLIILDSDHDNLSAAEWSLEKKFLADQLAGPRAPWTICCAHHPLFSNGIAADNGILQRDWGILFKKYNVDIYLCGHEHNLQHLEIPGWKTSFVLAGGGGAHAHPMLRDNRGPFSRSIYGFVHFDFTPAELSVHYIGADGEPVHVFQKSKAGDVKTLMSTPSDPGTSRPLEAIQGLYDKLHPATMPSTTRPAAK